MCILINIDVPDLGQAQAFYTAAFGLTPGRRLGTSALELLGWPAPVYLLENRGGTVGAGAARRSYERHWTPIHIDVVVTDLASALGRAIEAGAVPEGESREEVWGRIATLADPFGHGFCLIQFQNRGYDELVDPPGLPQH